MQEKRQKSLQLVKNIREELILSCLQGMEGSQWLLRDRLGKDGNLERERVWTIGENIKYYIWRESFCLRFGKTVASLRKLF